MFLMDETDPDSPKDTVQTDPVVAINPKILKLEGDWEFDFEGCLSVPLLAALVPRATIAHVAYIDVKGALVTRKLCGWAARIFQHEVGQAYSRCSVRARKLKLMPLSQVDHLNGVMFLDRVRAPQHIVMESELVSAHSKLDVASVLALSSTPFEKSVKLPKGAKFSRPKV
jgi:peptide deformylase